MNAKELRIGNWVETYGVMMAGSWFDKEGNIHEQDVVTEPIVRRKQIDIEDLKIISASPLATYRGIPITQEILYEAGFKSKGAFYEKERVQIMWGYTDKKGDFFHYTVDEVVQYSCFKYVHQLQNLYFALTGKELEITL